MAANKDKRKGVDYCKKHALGEKALQNTMKITTAKISILAPMNIGRKKEKQ